MTVLICSDAMPPCRFAFPSAEHLGQDVLRIQGLTHGYQDRKLFDEADLHIEKGERVAVMGAWPLHVTAAPVIAAQAAGTCCMVAFLLSGILTSEQGQTALQMLAGC